jgi:hypothetical protein
MDTVDLDQKLPDNLNTFKVLYYIKGALNLCFLFIPMAWIGIFSNMPTEEFNDPTVPFNVEYFLIGIIAIVVLFALGSGIGSIMAGNYLGQRKNRTFILVVAILNCFTGVLGIVLGIFTIVEIQKPHVRERFLN